MLPKGNLSSLIHASPVVLLFLTMIGMWFAFTQAFIADDSYFYLVISRNLVLEGHQTFSGIMPTNGVHPLWLYLLTAWSWVVSTLFGPDILSNPKSALPLSISLLAGGCVVWWKIGGILRTFQPLLVFTPLAFTTFFGVLYSEIHILFFTLSLLVLFIVRQNGGLARYALIGVLGALVTLSRLDAVFLVGALGVVLLISEKDMRGLAIMVLAFAALTLPYLAANYFVFGHIVPVSGFTKSSFPEIFVRGIQAQGGRLTLSFEGYSIIFGIAPIVFALALWPSYGDRRTKLIVATLLGGAILQFLQIALFTKSHTAWYWYYLIPVTLGALAVAHLAARVIDRRIPLRTVLSIALFSLTALLAVVTVIIRYDAPKSSSQSLSALAFVTEDSVNETMFFVSDWPGYFAYSSPSNRVAAADMLTANVSFVREMQNSQNAVRYLFDKTFEIDRPVRYVIFMGNEWLVPSSNYECVIFNDPLHYPVVHEIGRAHLGQPIESSKENMFIIWDASDPFFVVAYDDPICGASGL